MANRRNYSASLNGRQASTAPNGTVTYTTITGAFKAQRSQNDTRRAKPVGRFIKPTAYVMSESSDTWATGTFYSYSKNSGYSNILTGQLNVVTSTISQRDTMNGGLSENIDAALSNRALQKARNNLKAQKVNLGQAFAERRQVSSQMLETASKFNCAIGSLLNHKNMRGLRQAASCLGVGAPKKLASTVAGNWLGLKYGWLPLLSDIHGAVQALDSRDRTEWMVTVKGKASSIGEDHRDYGTTGNANACYANSKVWKGCFVRIDATPSNSAVATAASLGLTNPAQLAWELLPYSFVVDWFLPVGDYLTQLDSCAGWDIRGFSSSDFVRAEWEWHGRSTFSTANGGTTYHNDWRSRRRYVALNRSTANSVPFPILPWIKDPVTESNVKNALALLVQGFLKRK